MDLHRFRFRSIFLLSKKFGRPALTVAEPWAVKESRSGFLRAVSAQNLALFGLVLLGAMVLVSETGYISVVRRRREFGVLRALGWRTMSIAWLIELEMLLGLAVGVLAVALGLPIMLRLGAWHVRLAAWSCRAAGGRNFDARFGIVPALTAARGSTLAMIQSIGRANVTNRLSAETAWSGLRGESCTANGEPRRLSVHSRPHLARLRSGVLVLISAAFRGQLDTTVLGDLPCG